jgi:hypothetical protein
MNPSIYNEYLFIAGQPAKFMVNTVNAGPGALGVTVEGPSKVKLECTEKDEGYEFSYFPTAPGDYLITIRYAGVHIAGSPFKAKIGGKIMMLIFYETFTVRVVKICIIPLEASSSITLVVMSV